MKRISLIVLSLLLLIGFVPLMAADSNTITVGMECNYAPFNWTQTSEANGAVPLDGGGYCNGYDVQIAKIVAEGLGKNLVVKKIEWDGLEPALKSGVIDLIIAGMTPTPERQQSMNFSDPYFESRIVMLVNRDSTFADATSIQDFSGAKVVSQLNTFHVDLVDQINGVQKQSPMNDYPSMTVALKSGRVDAVTAELIVAKSIVASNKDLTYIDFEEGKGFDLGNNLVTVAVAMRPGEYELLNQINDILDGVSNEQRSMLADQAIQNQPQPMPEGFFAGSWYIVQNYSSVLAKGVMITLFIALVGTILGFFLGLLIAGLRGVRYLKPFIASYIEILRGTPMIVQAMLVYYGLAGIGYHIPTLVAGLLVVTVNTSAYMAEIIRGGIQSVDPGQVEAAQALGMKRSVYMIRVVFPQAIKNVLPAIGNEFVVNIKDTSVLNVISVTELFYQARTVAGIHYRTAETFFVVSIIYLILTLIVTRIIMIVEKRMNGKRSYTMSGSQTVPSAIIQHGGNE